MIRDPSDGTVRETTGTSQTMPVSKPGIDSGLPLESQKPEQQAKLEKSREWLKAYFKRNPEQGT